MKFCVSKIAQKQEPLLFILSCLIAILVYQVLESRPQSSQIKNSSFRILVNSPLCVTLVAVSGNRAKKQQPLLFIDDNKFCRRRRAMDKLTNKIYRQLVILPLTSNVVDGKKNSEPFILFTQKQLGLIFFLFQIFLSILSNLPLTRKTDTQKS